jgi:hypothetical protein
MSGGNSSSSGGYRPGSATDDCEIVEQTALNSVQANAVPQLRVGITLDVALVAQGNRQVLVARLPNGAPAGSLTPQSLVALLDCMRRGRSYVAHVIDIQGPALVRVEIRPL